MIVSHISLYTWYPSRKLGIANLQLWPASMSDATPNSAHFGSAKINTCEFCLVRPNFAIREDLYPRKFFALRYWTRVEGLILTTMFPTWAMKRCYTRLNTADMLAISCILACTCASPAAHYRQGEKSSLSHFYPWSTYHSSTTGNQMHHELFH